MNEGIMGIVPLWVDAGYRTPNLFFGPYFQYGFGFVGDSFQDACDVDGVDCSTKSIRLGAQVHYHFRPEASADPWLGYGFGYEWWSIAIDGPGGEVSFLSSGFELANFQAGLDFYPAPNFYLGPFVSFSLDQFGSVDTSCSGTASTVCARLGDGDIDDKSLHQWLLFGVRGGFTGFAR